MGASNSSYGFVISTFFLSVLYFSVARGSIQAAYSDLIDSLFDGYKPEVRPSNDDLATTVHINFWLLSIQNLDEKNQILSTSLMLDAIWTDPWLTWNASEFGNITQFRYPQKMLWLPDLVLVNTVQSQRQLGYDENPLRVYDDGSIDWLPSEIAHTSCDIDVTYYPFDTQICHIIISTWISTSRQINLKFYPNATDIIKIRFNPSGTWELSASHIIAVPNEEDLTMLIYSLKLRRLSTFFVMNMILPVLFMSLTASCVFYLPSDAGEKIGMSMTILLSYAVYLTIISDNMPQTSLQISILSVYLTMLLGITAFSVVLSVLILHWHHTPEEKEVGTKTTAIIRKLREVFHFQPKSSNDEKEDNVLELSRMREAANAMSNISSRSKGAKVSPVVISDGVTKVKVAEKPNENEEEEKITWPIVSETMDTVFFFSMSSFIIVLSIVALAILVIGGDIQNKKEFE